MKKQIEKEELVAAVFCRRCCRIFFDSLNWEATKDPKKDVAFVCPFCKTALWVK